jgi:hypothetical protein
MATSMQRRMNTVKPSRPFNMLLANLLGPSMYCVKGVNEKNFSVEVDFGESVDSADVFGRALGFRGTLFP